MAIILYLVIFGTAAVSLFLPWIGVLGYYTLAILFPQSLWPWIFQTIRVSLYISAATIVGFIGAALAGKLDYSVLKKKQNRYMLILWIMLAGSLVASPYGLNQTDDNVTNSMRLLSHLNKVFLFYFLSIIVIDTRAKLHALVIVFMVIIVYYTYWANDVYLSGLMMGDRLAGPGVFSIYVDENAFGMLFVMGTPFLYFMGSYYKNKIVKYLLWFTIPFAWHAIFLTASRGALVGVGVVTLYITMKSKSKTLGIAVLAALVIAFMWQGGILKERSTTIVEYEEEASAQGRLQAWEAGAGMIADHPITGVGLGNFMRAFPDFSNSHPRVAHSTIVQLTAECGIIAGIMYLLINFSIIFPALKIGSRKSEQQSNALLEAVRESYTSSLMGFFVCSLFLNLITYETFYYLLILNVVYMNLSSSTAVEVERSPDNPYRFG